MKVLKYETNFNKKIFFKEYLNINFKKDINNEENRIINIYPDICFNNFIGFGRCTYWFYML